MAYNLETRSGHNMFTMASLLQKAIRRGDKERAGYAAMELFGSYHSMLWNRIMTVSCEDCWGILAKEIVALRYTDDVRNRNRKGYEKDTVRNGNLKAASSLWRKPLCKNVKVVFG